MSRRSPEEVDRDHALHVGSGPHDGPRCRCRHDGMRWLEMCDAAKADAEAYRAAALKAKEIR